MNIRISKTDFELAVKAARDPKGKIFDVMQNSIEMQAEKIATNLLGTPGITAVEDNPEGILCMLVKRLACVSAFLREMRGLDLVLTHTGFGVVSTNDTAPASKMRVDALEGELKRTERQLRTDLITQLFQVSGWHETSQRLTVVETLFYSFFMLEYYAAISNPKPEDWDNNYPAVLAADAFLRKHIGNAYMDELISQMTSNSLPRQNVQIVRLCQKFIGAWIAQNRQLQDELYMRMINRLESDLSSYPTYAGSEAYRLNHFKQYENHAEDSAFHFVG